MSFISIDENFRLAHFGKDLVILDIMRDRYSIISNITISDIHNALLEKNINNNTELKKIISSLCITETDCLVQQEVCTLIPKGFFEYRWMLPITSERRANPLQLTQAFLAQRRAAHCLKTAGIKGVISEIDKSRSRIFSHRIIDAEKRQEKIDAVVSDLVKVNALKPSGNECLTFALALKLLLQRFLPDSQLIIGVRTRPFISHAWVEVSGKVIADVPNLRENLSTILIL